MTRVMRITVALAATVPLLPFAASAAELPVPASHHRITHVRHAYVPRQHLGYYFGHWGWRSGGTASSWYGSTFALAGGPWGGPGVVLKASPKSIVAIHCTERRPDACLGEPVVVPVAAAAPPVWR
ncbi:MAG TPA: hypothetical protein VFA80_04015 [Xanthobacteraceae bacterium]|nr:hypothetical protein [Xanthobacteraceae bacterium]